jgi:hypothetical protein
MAAQPDLAFGQQGEPEVAHHYTSMDTMMKIVKSASRERGWGHVRSVSEK